MNIFNIEHVTHGEAATWELARRLLKELPPSFTLALHGDLGSGKTCFVQGLAQGLGIRQPVTSPTFTVINEYRGPRALYHIDLYRLGGPDEALAIGLEDYLDADGVKAIEWAERAGPLLRPDTVHIYFKTLSGPDNRAIQIVARREVESEQ